MKSNRNLSEIVTSDYRSKQNSINNNIHTEKVSSSYSYVHEGQISGSTLKNETANNQFVNHTDVSSNYSSNGEKQIDRCIVHDRSTGSQDINYDNVSSINLHISNKQFNNCIVNNKLTDSQNTNYSDTSICHLCNSDVISCNALGCQVAINNEIQSDNIEKNGIQSNNNKNRVKSEQQLNNITNSINSNKHQLRNSMNNMSNSEQQSRSNTNSVNNNNHQLNDVLDNKSFSRKHNNKEPIPRTVWQVGMMMFLMNLSYVIAYSFSGLYLKHILGAATFSIAILEGLCEMVSFLMKLLSGVISDFLRKRKVLMIIGYTFSVISKPLLAFSNTFSFVLMSRIMERLGNGIQASPRDALVADVAPKNRIGASYGLKRSLAYAGSFLGGFVGIISMKLTDNNYQTVFIIASIPAFIAFTILIFCLKEPKQQTTENSTNDVTKQNEQNVQQIQRSKFSFSKLNHLGRSFWLIILINIVFMLARMDEQFLILRTNESFITDQALAPLVMIVMNLGAIIASYPIGVLGDRLNRKKMMIVSAVLLLLSDIVMFKATSKFTLFLGIGLWGMQVGASQNVFYSLIAENVSHDLRGTGLGIYWLCNALTIFIADSIAGKVSTKFGLQYTFLSSGICCTIALITLIIVMIKMNKYEKNEN